MVPVSLQVTINCDRHHESPNVEFSVFVQERLFYVLLNNITALLSVVCLVIADDAFYVT